MVLSRGEQVLASIHTPETALRSFPLGQALGVQVPFTTVFNRALQLKGLMQVVCVGLLYMRPGAHTAMQRPVVPFYGCHTKMQ